MVEMIVALVISVSLGLAIYTTFGQGLRLWSRAAKGRSEWKISLFLDKFTEELRNEFSDPKWKFQGNQAGLSFATMAHEGEDPAEKGPKDRPVYLRYGFDSYNRVVTLHKYSFKEMFAPKIPAKAAVPVLEKIRAFRLEYYVYDARAKGYRWKTLWNKNCFPGTVKVTIEPDETDGRSMTRIIDAPAGESCSEVGNKKTS